MQSSYNVSELINNPELFCKKFSSSELAQRNNFFRSRIADPLVDIVNFYSVYLEITKIIPNTDSVITPDDINRYTLFFEEICPRIVITTSSLQPSIPYFKNKKVLDVFANFLPERENGLKINITKSIGKFYTYSVNQGIHRIILQEYKQYQKNLNSIKVYLNKIISSNNSKCTFYDLNLRNIKDYVKRDYVKRDYAKLIYDSNIKFVIDSTKLKFVGEELFFIHFKEFKKRLSQHKQKYLYFIRHTDKKGFFVHLLVFNHNDIQEDILLMWKKATNYQGSMDCKYDFFSRDRFEQIIEISLLFNLCVPLQFSGHKKLLGKNITYQL